MRLVKVEYEFFDFEEPSDAVQVLARQIRLDFADAPAMFLSWTWERQHDSNSPPYSIGRSANSFFHDQPAAVVNASHSASWSRHLGHEVAVSFCPSTSPEFENQVIEVRSDGNSTFVFSLGLDKVSVSNASPIVPG
jgi:hypothetical protein